MRENNISWYSSAWLPGWVLSCPTDRPTGRLIGPSFTSCSVFPCFCPRLRLRLRLRLLLLLLSRVHPSIHRISQSVIESVCSGRMLRVFLPLATTTTNSAEKERDFCLSPRTHARSSISSSSSICTPTQGRNCCFLPSFLSLSRARGE
jgi:hypothetical protein